MSEAISTLLFKEVAYTTGVIDAAAKDIWLISVVYADLQGT